MPSRLGPPLILTLAVFALLAFGASAWAEKRALSQAPESVPLVAYQGGKNLPSFEAGATFSTDASDSSEGSNSLGILFKGADLIRVFPGTTFTVVSTDLAATPLQMVLRLESGSLWVSELHGVADIAVEAAYVRIDPDLASTWVSLGDVEASENEVDVFSARHSTRVVFLAGDESRSPLNDYLLTESHRVRVPVTSFDPTVADLRYTKLTKEYPFQYVEGDQWEDEWTQALNSDLDRQRSLASAFFSEVSRRDLSQPALRYVREALTLEKKRRMELDQSQALTLLYEAIYFNEKKEWAAGEERLQLFKQAVAGGRFDEDERAQLKSVFRAVLPGDPSYAVKELLRQDRLALSNLRDQLYEIYDLLHQGEPDEAEKALSALGQAWNVLFEKEGAALAESVKFLTEERQILAHLLYREKLFYRLEHYRVLAEFEDRILHLTAAEFDLNEERQAFVQDKIRMMTRLVALVEEKKVGAKAGSELGVKVIGDAEALLADLTQKAAVTDYFSTLLESFKPKFAFIASADFSLGKGTFDERYTAYLKKQADLSDLASYIGRLGEVEQGSEGAAGSVAGAISREQALQEALADFAEAGVTVAALMPLDDPGHRLFTVQGGRVGLEAFSGNYDRASGLIYDLRVGDKAFSAGVRLDQLAVTIRNVNQVEASDDSAMAGDETGGGVGGEGSTTLSPASKLALDLARQGFEGESGVELEPNSITLLDLNQNLFQIETSFSERNKNFEVRFTYDLDTHAVTSLTGSSQGIDFSVDSTTAAGFVEAVVSAFEAQVSASAESEEIAL